MTLTIETLFPTWAKELGVVEATAQPVLIAKADGWRHVYPDELGHLTATSARAQVRAENGIDHEETDEESASFAAILHEVVYLETALAS